MFRDVVRIKTNDQLGFRGCALQLFESNPVQVLNDSSLLNQIRVSQQPILQGGVRGAQLAPNRLVAPQRMKD
jgi:hypothetical protein